MDDALRIQILAQTEKHIARGAQHISDQELLVTDLSLLGHDVTLARSILETFRRTQSQHIAHRDQILRSLGQ